MSVTLHRTFRCSSSSTLLQQRTLLTSSLLSQPCYSRSQKTQLETALLSNLTAQVHTKMHSAGMNTHSGFRTFEHSLACQHGRYFSTSKPAALHADSLPLLSADHGAHSPVSMPIFQTATFQQSDCRKLGQYDYSRSANPTRSALEFTLQQLERAKHAVAVNSGMAAIALVAELLSAKYGDILLAADELYGGSTRLIEKIVKERGVQVKYVDATDVAQVKAALKAWHNTVQQTHPSNSNNPKHRKARAVMLLETPSNPSMKVADIQLLSRELHSYDGLLCVDGSLMSPWLQRPLEHGADVVVHSVTKFIGGHADATGGALLTNSDELSEQFRFLCNAMGYALSPFDSWLIQRGAKTIGVRVEKQQKNAEALVRFLQSHPLVSAVNYVGLPSHPGHHTHFRQASGGGSVFSFAVGESGLAEEFVNRLRLFKKSVSFGSVHSVVEIPFYYSHGWTAANSATNLQFGGELIRMSAGLENENDLIADLAVALKASHEEVEKQRKKFFIVSPNVATATTMAHLSQQSSYLAQQAAHLSTAPATRIQYQDATDTQEFQLTALLALAQQQSQPSNSLLLDEEDIQAATPTQALRQQSSTVSLATLAIHGGENYWKISKSDGSPTNSQHRTSDDTVPSYHTLRGPGIRASGTMLDTLTTPIAHSSAFWFHNTADLVDYCEGRKESFEYGRYGNPTTRALELKLAAIEGMGDEQVDCLFSSSGMSSATTMLLALVQPNSHVVTTTDCYRRTRQFMQTMMAKLNVTVSVFDPAKVLLEENLPKLLREKKVSLFFSESPTNPYLRCVPIEAISKLCHQYGAHVCIDSTLATPINCLPLLHGADLVLHSATKYISGHNDVIAGAVVGKKELVQQVRATHGVLGGLLDPHAAWLILRGLKTLHLRVRQANKAGLALASYLESRTDVIERVCYPGLSSHADHQVAKQQMTGFGGVVSFEISADKRNGIDAKTRASRFIDSLRIPFIAPSFGGPESLVEQPAIISYHDKTPEERKQLGIHEGLVRFACGLEDEQDIIRDVAQALNRVA